MIFLRRFLAGIAILFYLHSYSQTAPGLNTSLIPPSPDAASIGKYGVYPVTLYTGMANVSIPITQLKTNKLTVDVTLGYNYNGYRPAEEASWVGLGWTLQAGGAITRVVKGKADDGWEYDHHWTDYANILDLTDNTDFMDVAGSGNMDTEPDIYIFHFNGHSGKFALVGDKPYLFPHQDLNISRYGNGFKIIAEDGTTYKFLETETTIPPNKSPNAPFMAEYISTWYLSEIVSPDGKDQIDFTYTPWTYRQAHSTYSETYITKSGTTSGGVGCYLCDSWTTNTFIGASVSAKQLSKISSKNGYIIFNPEATSRLDLSSPSAYALHEVVTYDSRDNLLKKATFNHSYFGNTSLSTNCQLKLSSIDLQGNYTNNTLGNSGPSTSAIMPGYYSFQYNNEGGDYPKLTRGIDRWGYFNGVTNNATLFEAAAIGHDIIQPSANRDVNTTYSSNGALAKIIYPTGGYTKFTYEVNRVKTSNTSTQPVQNQYVSLSVAYNNIDPTVDFKPFSIDHEQDISINFGRDITGYDYGVVNNIPILKVYSDNDPNSETGTLIFTSLKLGKSATSATATLHVTPGNYHFVVSCESTSLSSYANITYSKYIPSPVEGDPGPGLRIQSIESFDGSNATIPSLTKTYSYSVGKLISASTYGYYRVAHQNEWGFYDEHIYSSEYGSPLATLMNNQFYYPEVTEVNQAVAGSGKVVYAYNGGTDLLDVNLTSETTFKFNNGNYLSVLKKTNTYDYKSVIDIWGFTYNVNKINDAPSCNCNVGIPPLPSPNYLDTISRQILYVAHPYALSSEYTVLKATDELTYDQNGVNPLTVHKDYYYDNPNHVQPTRIITTTSKGEVMTTENKYAYDYSESGCKTPDGVNSDYKTARYNASIEYQNKVLERWNACRQYIVEGQYEQNTTLIMALRNYPCEVNYKAASQPIYDNLNRDSKGISDCLIGSYPFGGIIPLLQYYNIKSTPVEQVVSVNKSGTEYLVGATKTDYTFGASTGLQPETLYNAPVQPSTVTKASFTTNPSNYYEARVSFQYDEFGNIKQQSKTNDIAYSYIYGYNNLYPVAQVINAKSNEIYFADFEKSGWDTPIAWPLSAYDNTRAHTGRYSGRIDNDGPGEKIVHADQWLNISLAQPTKFKYSGWIYSTGPSADIYLFLKTATEQSYFTDVSSVQTTETNKWVYVEGEYTVPANITKLNIRIDNNSAGTVWYDDIRLYPSSAQMTTYTYDPLIGMTSQTDPNGRSTYYGYDGFGRLSLIRDQDYNILKKFCYNYAGQQEDCTTGCTTTTSNWQNTATPVRCRIVNGRNTGEQEQEQQDQNSCSSTFQQFRWVVVSTNCTVCAKPQNWQSTGNYRCVTDANGNYTGYQEREEQNMEQCSLSPMETRWVSDGYNPTACPLPSACSTTTCSGVDKKCINGMCQTGTKVCTSTTGTKFNWVTTYHYEWSDGTKSPDYTESSAGCLISFE